jgi:predicted nucleic acid-binding protein
MPLLRAEGRGSVKPFLAIRDNGLFLMVCSLGKTWTFSTGFDRLNMHELGMKEKIYLETSVISYHTARPSRDIIVLAQQELTWDWWEKSVPEFDVFISQAVIDEIRSGDPEAAEKRLDLIKEFPLLEISKNVENLAAVYIEKLKIPPRAASDAIHIAVACKHEVDYLVTWNCSHIANGVIIKQLLNVNTRQGVKTPVVCTPGELLEIDYAERPDY